MSASYTRVWDEDELEEYRKPGGCGRTECDGDCKTCEDNGRRFNKYAPKESPK